MEFDTDFDKLTKLKNFDAFTNQMKNGIETISGNKKPNKKIYYGSYTYKSQLYPGDIDLIELTEKCCDVKTALQKFARQMQTIVRNIQKKPGTYVGDIKAGWDYPLKLNIGYIRYDNLGNYYINDYNPSKIRNDFHDLYKKGFIDGNEYKALSYLVKDKPTNLEYETLVQKLREKWLLRWTADEVLRGYKILKPNRKLSLANAIGTPTMTKIDMWTVINNKYIEISNMMIFYLIDKKGNRTLLNLVPPDYLYDVIEDLRYDIQKMSFSPLYMKPFKAIKRMWAVARLIKDPVMINKLTPIMQTDLGRLSQINAELEVMVLMLFNVKNLPVSEINRMKQSINQIRYRLENIYQIDLDEHYISKMFDNIMNSKNKDVMKNLLVKLRKYFKSLIEPEALRILKEKGLFPPPMKYLPDAKSYNPIKKYSEYNS